MTVLEGIQKSTEFLERKGIESARLHAELLLANVLKLPRIQLYLSFDHVLKEQEVDAFREYVRRRGQREPMQHIVSSTSFCGIELAVNKNALVPRPETELLAETGWCFLSSLKAEIPRAWDIGTGSGCIAIALSKKCPNVRVLASDISMTALELAKHNAATNNVAGQIEFSVQDGFTSASQDRQFDLIISNPPYIATAEIETLEPEVREFDPHIALDGGADGLDFYRRFALEAGQFLKSHGKLMLEFGDGQAEVIKKIFQNQNWIVEAIQEDYTHRPRILIATLPGLAAS